MLPLLGPGCAVREVALVAALTVTAIASLAATVGRCLPVPDAWAAAAEQEGSKGLWIQHTCPAGQYNDLATAWLGPPGVAEARAPSSLNVLEGQRNVPWSPDQTWQPQCCTHDCLPVPTFGALVPLYPAAGLQSGPSAR